MNQETDLPININLNMPIEGLISSIKRDLSKDEIINLVKAIDLEVAEYDFTIKLRDYFVKEIEKEDKLQN